MDDVILIADDKSTDKPVLSVPETAPDKSGDKRFTQVELEEVLKERLKRGEEAATKRLLEALGVSDVETAKNALKAHSEAEEAKRTELDKLQLKLTAMEQRAMKAETALESLKTERQTDRRNQTLIDVLTTDGKATNAKRLLTLLSTEQAALMADLFNDEDVPVKEKVTPLLEMAKKTYPEYFTVTTPLPGSPSNRRGSIPEPNAAEKEVALKDFRRRVKSMF